MNYTYNSLRILCLCLFTTLYMKGQEVKTLVSDFSGNGAVSVTPDGHVLVSEYGQWSGNQGDGTRIFKIHPNGHIVDTLTGFKSPMGTAHDSSGNLFVNNDNNMERGQVLKITPDGKRTVFATIQGWPSGMHIDPENNLYIPNYNKGILNKITSSGEVSVMAEDKRLLGCTGIDMDSNGNIIISNFATACVYSITPKGVINEIVCIPDIVIQNFGIGYITVINDSIYATGISSGKIFKISLDGSFSIIAGNGTRVSKDGKGIASGFNGPNGISADKKAAILYISEYGGSKMVRKIKL